MRWNPFRKDRPANPEFTPDLALLENRGSHLLFNYGDEFSHVPCVSGAFTEERMVLWNQRTVQGGHPVALQGTTQEKFTNKSAGSLYRRQIPRCRIGGWLYEMSTQDLIYLDEHLHNGVEFQRKRIALRLPVPSQTRTGMFSWREYTLQRAHMYVGVKTCWEPKILWDAEFHRGNGTSALEPARVIPADDCQWLKRYYQFQRKKTVPVIHKTYVYFKHGQGQVEPWEPPPLPGPTPADEMRRPGVSVIDGMTMILKEK